ncbi:unnamed protein product [Acidithrix sp. C25]|nr:unnamed protein product [Acidithrix sp. C25]
MVPGNTIIDVIGLAQCCDIGAALTVALHPLLGYITLT